MTQDIIPVPNTVKRNLLGQRFGKLTVIAYAGRNQFDHHLWLCRCDCGNEKTSTTSSLCAGRTIACGCYSPHRTHGMSKTPEYKIWTAMVQRCTTVKHQAYKDYGGRGIKVCERWRHSFENFLDDMGKRPSPLYSLDRIDNDGNYEPGNCRWATQTEQTNNQRNNHIVEFNGESLTINQWAEKTGINSTTIHQRIKRGWSIEQILTEPVAHGKRWRNHIR